MKNLIATIAFLVLGVTINLNAQLLVDDFSTGPFAKKAFDIGTSTHFFQNGTGIIGKDRRIYTKVNQNPYNQDIQVTVKKGFLVISAAYDTRGTVYVGYGHNKKGLVPMNKDVSKYKTLKIKFAAKSTINGIYVSLFTGTSRGVFSSHVQAREGEFTFPIPLRSIKKIGPNYTLSDIDYIRFQFDSRSKTGCNMAIDKIWFE